MRKVYIPLLLSILVFSGLSCLKSETCTPKTPASEATQIEQYAVGNSINATAHSSGLYYEIVDPGTGVAPSISSKIVISYTGKLTNGTVFDQQNNQGPWSLSDLIEGWRVGLPLIKEGGHIKLIVPSSMAYGCNPYGSIPGNSILFFDIYLLDVQ